MKKLLLFLVTLFIAMNSWAQNVFVEDFETGYTDQSSIGAPWIQDISSNSWIANTSLTSYNRTPRTGDWNAYLRYSSTGWIYRAVELTGGSPYQFEMYARQDVSSGCDMKVSYGASATASDMTNEIVALTPIGSSFVKLEGIFTPEVSGTYYLGIYATLTYSPYYVSIDDIKLGPPPACPAPTNLEVSNITSSSATLTWEAGAGTSWTIEGSLDGETWQQMGTSNDGSFSYSGLDPQTTYYARVKANCGDEMSDWSAEISFTTPCAALIAPTTTETFTSVPPNDCWSEATGILGDISTTLTMGSSAWAGSGEAKLNIYGTSRKEWLITPSIDLGDGSTDYMLNFDLALTAYGNSNVAEMDGSDDRFIVLISTDNGSTWNATNALRTWDNAGSEFIYNNIATAGEPVIIDLTGYTGEVKFAFYGESTASNADNDLHINNFKVVELSSCFPPTAITANNITATSATLTWVASEGHTMYDVRYSDDDGETWTDVLENELTSITLTDLVPQTTYTVQVKANCGNEMSDWSAEISFTTACASITEFPWNCGFEEAWMTEIATPGNEEAPTCWLNFDNSNTSYQWTRTTSTSYIKSGTAAAYLYSYNYSNPENDWLITPAFNLTGGEMLSFYAKNVGSNASYESYIGVYMLPVDENGNIDTETAVELIPSTMVDQTWNLFSTDLMDYAGTYRIAFVSEKPSGGTYPAYYQYLGLDDITIEAMPSCMVPTALATNEVTSSNVALTWEDEYNVDPLGYKIEYKKENETEWQSTTVSGTIITLSGLDHATTYEARVAAICTIEDNSDFTSVVTFTTSCPEAFAVPTAIEVFNTMPPTCWEKASGQLPASENATLTSTTLGWSADGFANVGSTGAARMNIYGSNKYWLITPPIDLGDGAVGYKLNFDLALTDYGNSNVAEMDGSDDKFIVLISTDNGETWNAANALRMWDNAGSEYVYNDIATDGENVEISLIGYTGVVKFAFYGESTVSNADNDLFVDNFVVNEIPPCPTPANLTITNLAHYSATLNWEANGATAWTVKVGEEGEEVEVNTNTFNLEDLSEQTPYTVYVKAVCEFNQSEWISTTFTTNARPCIAATNITSSQITETTATITWEGDGPWHVRLNNEETLIALPNGTETYTFEELAPETTYNAFVRADCDYNDNGNVSEWISTEFTTLAVCEPITDIATPIVTEYTANLAWAAGEANAWKLKLGEEGDVVELETPAYNFTELMPNTEYTAYVKVNCQVNESVWTPITFTTWAVCEPATELTVANVTEYTADFTFNGGDYNAWFMKVGEEGETVVLETPSYQFTDLTPSTTYILYVMSDCGVNQSEWVSYEFRTLDICPIVTDITYANVDHSSADIAWTPAEGTDAWQVRVTTEGEILDVTEPNIHLTLLESEADIDVYVRTNCHVNVSQWEMVTFTTDTAPCPIPLNLAATIVNPSTVTLTWDVVEETQYQVRLGENGMIIPMYEVGTYTLTNLSYATDYTAYVRVDCGSAQSDWMPASFTTTTPECDIPYNVENVEVLHNAATIAWDAADATAWQVRLQYYGDIIDVTNNNYEFEGLEEMSTYIAYVRTNCGDFYSEWVPTAFTTEPAPCLAPENLVVTEVNDSEIYITWNAGDATAWQVKLTEDGDIYNFNETSIYAYGLLSDTEYTVYVRTDCGINQSEWVSITATTLCDEVEIHENVQVSHNAAVVYYHSEADAVQVRCPNGEIIDLPTTPGSWVPYFITDLDDATTYTYEFRSDCGHSQTEWVPVTFTTELAECDTPEDITLIDIDFHSAAITWTNGADHVQVRVGEDGNIVNVYGSDMYQFVEFSKGTEYELFVRNICAPNVISDWRSITVTTPCDDDITNLAVNNITHTNATFTWEGAEGTDAWIVRLGETGEEVTVYEETYEFTNLTASTNYTAYVKTQCNSVEGDLWLSVDFATDRMPCEVNGLEVTDFTHDVATIAWQQGVGMNWQVKLGEEGTVIDVTAPTHTFTALEGETEYTAYVKAICGEGDYQSEWVSVTFVTGITPCVLPDNVAATNITDVTATLAWNGGWATAWDVRLGEDGEIVPVTTNTYTFEGLTSLTDYTAYVRSNCGEENISEWVAVTFTTDYHPCYVPTGLAVSNILGNAALISWTEQNEATAWQLQYKATADAEWTTVEVSENPYLLEELAGLTNYSVKVASYCVAGNTSDFATASFTTPCEALTVPTAIQEFNTYVPECWEESAGLLPETGEAILTGTTSSWLSSSNNCGGSIAAAHPKLNIYGSSADEWLISQSIDLGNEGVAAQLEFDAHLRDYSYSGTPGAPDMDGDDDRFAVVISTDNGTTWAAANATVWSNEAGAERSFNALATQQHVILPLVDANGMPYQGVVKIAFYGESTVNNADNDLHIDNFVVLPLADCNRPSGIAVNNITATTATAQFVESGFATEWEYVLDATGTMTEPEGTPVPTTATIVDFENLQPATTYTMWVRAICDDATSDWSTPTTFTTTVLPMELPVLIDFETEGQMTLNNGAQTNSWYIGALGANASNGGLYISEDDGATYGYDVTSSSVVQATALILFPDASEFNLSFDWKADGESTYDYVRAYLAPANLVVAPGTQVASTYKIAQLNQEAEWQHFSTGLDATYADAMWQLIIEWRNDGSGGTQPPAAIDNISITQPSCFRPINIEIAELTSNSVTMLWDDMGSDSYVITFEGEEFTTVENSYTLDGLAAATDYEITLASVCGETTSAQEIIEFTTPCEVLTPTVTEDFTTFLPSCWEKASGILPLTDNAVLTPVTSSYTGWAADGFANDGTTGAARLNIYGTLVKYWLISPSIDLGDGSTDYMLDFDFALTAYSGTGAATGECTDDKLGVLISTDNGMTWNAENMLRVWDNAGSEHVYNSIPNTGETANINLAGYSGTVKIAFYGESTMSGGDNNVYIDNVRIYDPLPPCELPSALAATAINHNAATIEWNGGDATNWQVRLEDGETENVTDAMFTFNNLDEMTTYTAYVRTVCELNESAWIPVTFSTTEYTPCYTPISLAIDDVTTESAVFTWGILSGSAWQVKLNNDGAIIDVNEQMYTFTGLNADTEYVAYVRTNCGGEFSPWMYIMFYTDEAVNPCADPTALATNNITPVSANLTWNGGNAAIWNVKLGANGDVNTVVGESFTFSSLTPNTTYTAYVRTDCGNAQSAWVSETFSTTSVPAPTDVLVQSVSYNSAILTWDGGEQTNWQVRLASDDNMVQNVIIEEYEFANLEPATTYNAYVRTDINGYYSPWMVTSITTPAYNALGINDLNLQNAVKLYPNPATQFITIDAEGIAIENVEIMDMTGRIVMITNETTINVDAMEIGVYFARITTANGVATLRFVKQ